MSVSLSNILFAYSGLSVPDIVARLSIAMPPQGFGGSQGSDGDYHWSTYEQYNPLRTETSALLFEVGDLISEPHQGLITGKP